MLNICDLIELSEISPVHSLKGQTVKRFIIERYDPDYRDEETGKIPWSVFDTANPDKGRETFTTKAQAVAYVEYVQGQETLRAETP